MSELAVKCDGLEKRYGAGKTTTIEILEGLLEADAGDVEILGLKWKSHERDLRERLGIHLLENPAQRETDR